MGFYLFIIVGAILYLFLIFFIKFNRLLFTLGIFGFILFFSLLGGLRDTSIGIDLRVYGVEYFYYALFSNSFSDLIRNSPTSEYGYIILNYICSLLSTEINFSFYKRIYKN